MDTKTPSIDEVINQSNKLFLENDFEAMGIIEDKLENTCNLKDIQKFVSHTRRFHKQNPDTLNAYLAYIEVKRDISPGDMWECFYDDCFDGTFND